jgi:hypothetical protein
MIIFVCRMERVTRGCLTTCDVQRFFYESERSFVSLCKLFFNNFPSCPTQFIHYALADENFVDYLKYLKNFESAIYGLSYTVYIAEKNCVRNSS